jgi:CyaY protein
MRRSRLSGTDRTSYDDYDDAAPVTGRRSLAMNDSEFNQKAADTLWRIEEAVESADADIDFESNGDVLTLTFDNGSRVIVNKQGVLKQLWVAARSGGFHYSYDAARNEWRNDQTGAELFSELSRLVSEQAQRPVRLSVAPPA